MLQCFSLLILRRSLEFQETLLLKMSVALTVSDKDPSWYHQQRGFDHINLSTLMKKPVDRAKLSDR